MIDTYIDQIRAYGNVAKNTPLDKDILEDYTKVLETKFGLKKEVMVYLNKENSFLLVKQIRDIYSSHEGTVNLQFIYNPYRLISDFSLFLNGYQFYFIIKEDLKQAKAILLPIMEKSSFTGFQASLLVELDE